MKAIRQIVDLDKLGCVINIPKDFKYNKVEVIIFPADDSIQTEKEKFVPETFYGISSISDPAEAVRSIRDEWDRI
ncbi:hypothetical protein [Desulfotignum phosphitoxidans]|jgi:hypothetical protein|uniref:Uncharacterized protein n=1 Tax=Desulfotignum phosphitoxidans DSM 13687 TaxID=1286635 RepID=S0G0K0_9BACT|nr:hypothetical protein [Desulfotignum phosphitoxidans]EMS77717.1 hypothetical protein Dpo_13c01150 [Desulfotignum phosphitoxidans DSM 13687]